MYVYMVLGPTPGEHDPDRSHGVLAGVMAKKAPGPNGLRKRPNWFLQSNFPPSHLAVRLKRSLPFLSEKFHDYPTPCLFSRLKPVNKPCLGSFLILKSIISEDKRVPSTLSCDVNTSQYLKHYIQ